MSDTQFYLTLAGGIVFAFVMAWAIVAVIERQRCDREDGNYNCHGENCEGCYKMIGGQVVYNNPQPANKYGEAPLTPWI